jgi:hypothetical protein
VRCATVTDAFGRAEEITTTKALVTAPDWSVLTDEPRATTTATDRSTATQAGPGELTANRIADDIVSEAGGCAGSWPCPAPGSTAARVNDLIFT